MEQTILRHEVLKELDTGKPFDLVFLTADRKRGTGGKIKNVKGWAKIIGDHNSMVRRPGEFRKVNAVKKNPKHSEHKTVNIFNPSNSLDHTITVHWRLMQFFNGKRILQ
jgi:hypothetical protein